MTDWVNSIAGTPQGTQIAILIALISALLHAIFGSLQNYKTEPVLSRAVIDFSYGVFAAPVALFLVPWPEPHLWPLFLAVLVIHLFYKIFQSASYRTGDYSLVYPIMRGTAPLFTIVAAAVFFGERLSLGQLFGIIMLIIGIFGLGFLGSKKKVDIRKKPHIWPAVFFAICTGIVIASYTTLDAFVLRQTENPLTFLAWLFFLDGLIFPCLVALFWRLDLRSENPVQLLGLGVSGALVALAGFGSFLLATRIGNLGETAAMRETSVVFAALIGWIFLKERVSASRFLLIIVIAIGAILINVAR